MRRASNGLPMPVERLNWQSVWAIRFDMSSSAMTMPPSCVCLDVEYHLSSLSPVQSLCASETRVRTSRFPVMVLAVQTVLVQCEEQFLFSE